MRLLDQLMGVSSSPFYLTSLVVSHDGEIVEKCVPYLESEPVNLSASRFLGLLKHFVTYMKKKCMSVRTKNVFMNVAAITFTQ